MKIYPAIDLLDKKAVRLTKGDFSTAKSYSEDPLTVAKEFAEAGAAYLHVVDLEGAKNGKPVSLEILSSIISETSLKVQVGGGIRSFEGASSLINSGVDRLIIGSLAVKDFDLTESIIKEFGPDHITLALDCQRCDTEQPMMAIYGWQTESTFTLWDLLERYLKLGPMRVLCTDIDRDGMSSGSNHTLYKRILKRYPDINIQASGGISSLSEIEELAKMGMESCVIGKSLYEGDFTLTDALKCKGISC